MWFNGYQVFSHDNVTEPRIQLSPDFKWCSEEFRNKMNAKWEIMFGRRPAMFVVNGGMIFAHPEIVEKLKELKKQEEKDINNYFNSLGGIK